MTTTNGIISANDQEYMDVKIAVPWGYLAGRWCGNRAVRPILALHGWLDNLGTWNNLLPLLPKHLGVLCIDLPGHGHSSKLPKGIMYNSIDFVGIVMLIMQEYQWPKVSFLAHSMGGRVAFFFAAVYPQRVDMIISIDVLHPHFDPPDVYIQSIRTNFEKFKVEDDRLANTKNNEPPSYTIEQLKRIQYEGSNRSVEPGNSHHIYERNVTKSDKYPDKYYFSRDGRIKYYFRLVVSPSSGAEMAARLIDIPFVVIKASQSTTITKDSQEVIDVLRKNNPNFELHELQGTHHIHLNNAPAVAEIVNRFIYRHRLPLSEN